MKDQSRAFGPGDNSAFLALQLLCQIVKSRCITLGRIPAHNRREMQ